MLRGWPLFVSWVFLTWTGGVYCPTQEATANPPAIPDLPEVLEFSEKAKWACRQSKADRWRLLLWRH